MKDRRKSLNCNHQYSETDSASSDSDIDNLVDEFIDKLSHFSARSDDMTIKNRKDRLRGDSAKASSSTSRHPYGYRPYHHPREKDPTDHRSRPHSSRSEGTAVAESSHGQLPIPYQYLDSPICPQTQAFGQCSSMLLPVTQSVDILDPLDMGDSSLDQCPETITDAENNSEDEYIAGTRNRHSNLKADVERLECILGEKRGWKVYKVNGDGACLFRSVAHQIYGEEDKHDVVRTQVMDYMTKNKEHFSPYLTEDFDRYVKRKREPTCHGNNIEIQAISELYNRPVEIYRDSVDPINVFHADYSKEFPIRLSYHEHIHYNSIFDPFNPSFGKGLGMPDYQPSLTENDLMTQALLASEETQMHEVIRSTIAESEKKEIEQCLEDHAIQASVATYMSQLGIPTAKTTTTPTQTRLPVNQSLSSNSKASSSATNLPETSSSPVPIPSGSGSNPSFTSFLPSDMRGMDEESIMAIVLERSRLEYFQTMHNKSDDEASPSAAASSPAAASCPSVHCDTEPQLPDSS